MAIPPGAALSDAVLRQLSSPPHVEVGLDVEVISSDPINHRQGAAPASIESLFPPAADPGRTYP